MSKYLFVLFASLLLVNAANSQELENLGSYSYMRFSTGHQYVSEFKLWSASGNIMGVFISAYGLYGDNKPTIHKILSGSISNNGDIEFKTKWYQFKGKYTKSKLEGVLRQNSEIIWGGVEGSNVMILLKGSNFKKIKGDRDIDSMVELNKWISKLIMDNKTI